MSRKYNFHNKEGLHVISFATVYWMDVFVREQVMTLFKDIEKVLFLFLMFGPKFPRRNNFGRFKRAHFKVVGIPSHNKICFALSCQF